MNTTIFSKSALQRPMPVLLTVLTVFSLLMSLMPMQVLVAEASDHQITICHATGGNTYSSPNPTKAQIYADISSDGANAHGSFESGVHPDDIIPPFSAGSQGNTSWGDYPGKNWNSAGQTIWNNECIAAAPTIGKLTVTKTVAGDGATATPDDFSLMVGATAVLSGVSNEFAPDTYTVSETNLDNYTPGDWGGDCTSDGSITLAAGDDKTCTITNTYVAPPETCDDGIMNQDETGIDTGGVCDTAPPVETCDDGIQNQDETGIDTGGVCAVPPSDKATLYVVKKLVQDNGGTDLVSGFSFKIPGLTNEETWDDTETLVVGDITYATTSIEISTSKKYDVIEKTTPAFEGRYNISTDNCSNIQLKKDEEATCVITNDDIQPKLTVIKEVYNLNGTIKPPLSPEDFTMLVTGTNVSSSSFAGTMTGFIVRLDAGSYSVDEEDTFGYFKNDSDPNCSGTIDIGEKKTCTITNSDEPIYGCTDSAANNYDETATNDDGSCDFNYLTQCVESPNLLQNGSFEEPEVSGWSIKTIVPYWNISLSDGLELWNGLGIGASDGEQNVELDGNDATMITQTVAGLVPGATYELSFDFAARSADAADNHIEAAVDGGSLVNVSTGDTDWLKYGATFVSDGSADVSFVDLGTPQNSGGTGTLLDNAVLCLVSDTYIIEGYVWHDDNQNEEWEGFGQEPSEGDEDSLEGWTVRITNGEGDDRETTTDEEGYYSFEVPAGTWTITEEVKAGWERTTKASHVVTVPEPEEVTLLDTVLEFIIPTAHAASAVAVYGPYNFGNDLEEESVDDDDDDGPTSYSSGTRTNRTSRPTPQVQGVSTSAPTPLVLGEQVSVVPIGAPNAGGGGASPVSVDFGNIIAIALLGRNRRNGK